MRVNRTANSCANTLKPRIHDRIFLPVFVIEVPPLGFIDREPFRLHRPSQQLSMPTLERSAARIIRISAIGGFVVGADHLDGLAGLQIVERQVNRTTSIVTRALRWIG